MNTCFFFLIILFISITTGHAAQASRVYMELNPYQEFLEDGTYRDMDWSPYDKEIPASRFESFVYAFEWFEQHKGKIVVELGTSCSFVHDGLPGCNSNDSTYWMPHDPKSWDWGAGFFTRMCAAALNPLSPVIHTVDICAEHIRRCKIITEPYAHLIQYHIASSVDFLKRWPKHKKIDLIYLDTGDMTPIEPTAKLQLDEVKMIVERALLASRGIIVIDDVRNQTPRKFGDTSGFGKSKYSLPYLLGHGFKIIFDGYQIILTKR